MYYLSSFRGLSCTLKHLYPVSGYCISPGRQKDLKKKKKEESTLDISVKCRACSVGHILLWSHILFSKKNEPAGNEA